MADESRSCQQRGRQLPGSGKGHSFSSRSSGRAVVQISDFCSPAYNLICQTAISDELCQRWRWRCQIENRFRGTAEIREITRHHLPGEWSNSAGWQVTAGGIITLTSGLVAAVQLIQFRLVCSTATRDALPQKRPKVLMYAEHYYTPPLGAITLTTGTAKSEKTTIDRYI
ncbi:unnamed protein product [Soboliphyme baturini]|uniref:DUF5683 domain-containing protein n=1 Tax=Soboliphyme baturini TaxID=241478 RepID=A0A183IBB2_9BILA|nr:unnamed protein product [Soboliphyme baturini]